MEKDGTTEVKIETEPGQKKNSADKSSATE